MGLMPYQIDCALNDPRTGVSVLCLLGCWLGCCLAPLCLDAHKDAYHRCTKCRKVVGVRRSARFCR